MFGLNLVRSALATLAANITGLASTVADVNANLRARAALDGPGALDTPALTIDGKAPGVAQDATDAADGPDATPTPPASRNGRRRATAATE